MIQATDITVHVQPTLFTTNVKTLLTLDKIYCTETDKQNLYSKICCVSWHVIP